MECSLMCLQMRNMLSEVDVATTLHVLEGTQSIAC